MILQKNWSGFVKSRMVTGRTGRTDECIETIRFEMGRSPVGS